MCLPELDRRPASYHLGALGTVSISVTLSKVEHPSEPADRFGQILIKDVREDVIRGHGTVLRRHFCIVT